MHIIDDLDASKLREILCVYGLESGEEGLVGYSNRGSRKFFDSRTMDYPSTILSNSRTVFYRVMQEDKSGRVEFEIRLANQVNCLASRRSSPDWLESAHVMVLTARRGFLKVSGSFHEVGNTSDFYDSSSQLHR
jgi:hypothetical protein